MSDSEASDATPSSKTLEKGLRDAVQAVFTASEFQPEELTVRRMRAAAEKALNLPSNFFKEHDEWSQKSKEIIQSEADAQHARQEDEAAAASTAPAKGKPAVSAASTKPAAKKASTSNRGTKRSSPESKAAPRKRQKKQPTPESEIEEHKVSEDDSEEEKAPKPAQSKAKARRAKRRSVELESEGPISDVEEPEKDTTERESTEKSAGNTVDEKPTPHEDSESELSSPLDEEPVRKKGKKQTGSSTTKRKGAKTKSANPSKESAELDPEDAEIKRLQSWLLKCGIRKMWYRELAPYDTKRAKIAHLRDMLKEAGMDGRFSAEKAKKIKEERELKAELEAVQDGAKIWGHSGSEDEEDDSKTGQKPRRRLARGLRELDFLGDDGEETD